MTKTEFIIRLNEALITLPFAERNEIISDYDQHFIVGMRSGKSEAEIAKDLGDPGYIAKQYLAGNDDFVIKEEFQVKDDSKETVLRQGKSAVHVKKGRVEVNSGKNNIVVSGDALEGLDETINKAVEDALAKNKKVAKPAKKKSFIGSFFKILFKIIAFAALLILLLPVIIVVGAVFLALWCIGVAISLGGVGAAIFSFAALATPGLQIGAFLISVALIFVGIIITLSMTKVSFKALIAVFKSLFGVFRSSATKIKEA